MLVTLKLFSKKSKNIALKNNFIIRLFIYRHLIIDFIAWYVYESNISFDLILRIIASLKKLLHVLIEKIDPVNLPFFMFPKNCVHSLKCFFPGMHAISYDFLC